MKNGKETLKIFLAIQPGRKISVIEPLLAPCFSARVVKGHLPLFRRSKTPLIKIEQIASDLKQVNRQDAIRRIAYQIWEEQGKPDGHSLEHWLEAETIWEKEKGKFFWTE